MLLAKGGARGRAASSTINTWLRRIFTATGPSPSRMAHGGVTVARTGRPQQSTTSPMQDRHHCWVRGFTFGNTRSFPPSDHHPHQLQNKAKAVRGTFRSSYKTKQRAVPSAIAKKRGRTRHHIYKILPPSHQLTKRGKRNGPFSHLLSNK